MPKGIKGFVKGHKHSLETKNKIGLANSKQVSKGEGGMNKKRLKAKMKEMGFDIKTTEEIKAELQAKIDDVPDNFKPK